MAGKNTAVFGIYSSYGAADAAVDALRTDGFRNTDISVMFPENVGTKDFAHEKGTKAPEGATTGAGTGAVVAPSGALVPFSCAKSLVPTFSGNMTEMSVFRNPSVRRASTAASAAPYEL